jgi:3',5'-cyclic-nucleotide phosphodiesterase
MPKLKQFIIGLLLSGLFINAANAQPYSFKIIPLGVHGGSDESNLSSYMIAPIKSSNYVCLDAGTLYSGIRVAIQNKNFHGSIDSVLRNCIKGYLISHAHLDHTAGMILNSPDDTAKSIYGLPSVLNIIRDKYFTWTSWANFANEGDEPHLNKYHYSRLDTAHETKIANTEMQVTAYSLSHGANYESTAFLVNHDNKYILYLGDTGPDSIEHSGKLQSLWQHVAPLIASKKLKAILIEVSFPNEQPDSQLFGHLTPKWLREELIALSKITGRSALKNFPIVVTHIKPIANNEIKIKRQLAAANDLKIKFIYPRQGVKLKF